MFDYLIQNARILDGSGGPARRGDVALSGGHIAAVGQLTDTTAVQVLDARGRYLFATMSSDELIIHEKNPRPS